MIRGRSRKFSLQYSFRPGKAMNSRTETSGARYLSAVWLFREVIRGDLINEKMREAALHSYEIVLRALESSEMASSISASGKLPPEKIRPSAKKIVESLLFERKGNPFASLGLSPFATTEDIHHRWKRLIAIYHPDRHPEERDLQGEEAAKKINEAYRKAMDIKALKPARAPFSPEKMSHRYQADTTKKWSIRTRPWKKAFVAIFRPSSIFFAVGVIVMAWAMASIYFQIGYTRDGLKKDPPSGGSYMESQAGKERHQLTGAVNAKNGKDPGWPVLMENNAPSKTYLLLPVMEKDSQGLSIKEAGKGNGQRAGKKNAASP